MAASWAGAWTRQYHPPPPSTTTTTSTNTTPTTVAPTNAPPAATAPTTNLRSPEAAQPACTRWRSAGRLMPSSVATGRQPGPC